MSRFLLDPTPPALPAYPAWISWFTEVGGKPLRSRMVALFPVPKGRSRTTTNRNLAVALVVRRMVAEGKWVGEKQPAGSDAFRTLSNLSREAVAAFLAYLAGLRVGGALQGVDARTGWAHPVDVDAMWTALQAMEQPAGGASAGAGAGGPGRAGDGCTGEDSGDDVDDVEDQNGAPQPHVAKRHCGDGGADPERAVGQPAAGSAASVLHPGPGPCPLCHRPTQGRGLEADHTTAGEELQRADVGFYSLDGLLAAVRKRTERERCARGDHACRAILKEILLLKQVDMTTRFDRMHACWPDVGTVRTSLGLEGGGANTWFACLPCVEALTQLCAAVVKCNLDLEERLHMLQFLKTILPGISEERLDAIRRALFGEPFRVRLPADFEARMLAVEEVLPLVHAKLGSLGLDPPAATAAEEDALTHFLRTAPWSMYLVLQQEVPALAGPGGSTQLVTLQTVLRNQFKVRCRADVARGTPSSLGKAVHITQSELARAGAPALTPAQVKGFTDFLQRACEVEDDTPSDLLGKMSLMGKLGAALGIRPR